MIDDVTLRERIRRIIKQPNNSKRSRLKSLIRGGTVACVIGAFSPLGTACAPLEDELLHDAAYMAPFDAGLDAGPEYMDAAYMAPDAGFDAGPEFMDAAYMAPDSGFDAGPEIVDAAPDSGFDAGPEFMDAAYMAPDSGDDDS